MSREAAEASVYSIAHAHAESARRVAERVTDPGEALRELDHCFVLAAETRAALEALEEE